MTITSTLSIGPPSHVSHGPLLSMGRLLVDWLDADSHALHRIVDGLPASCDPTWRHTPSMSDVLARLTNEDINKVNLFRNEGCEIRLLRVSRGRDYATGRVLFKYRLRAEFPDKPIDEGHVLVGMLEPTGHGG